MIYSMNKVSSVILLTTFMLATFKVNAVSISTTRLYLSPKSDTASIYVLNMESESQTCSLSVKGTIIDTNGLMQFLPKGQVAVNSAEKMIRFAPRRFEITPKLHQNIKLLYRRRPGLESGEYKGLLAIKCKKSVSNSEKQVTIEPVIVHNVPVIVRTGEIKISASFDSIKLLDKQVEVSIKIVGNRSITGDLEVIDKSSGEILASKKQMSIYSESPIKTIALPIDKEVSYPLVVRFKESPAFGGNLLIEQLVKSL